MNILNYHFRYGTEVGQIFIIRNVWFDYKLGCIRQVYVAWWSFWNDSADVSYKSSNISHSRFYEACPESKDTKVLKMYSIFNLQKRHYEWNACT